ncbi:YhjD/YihY/BrkB family envelope integrity protein [Raineyella sp.]|uniref:YhjD/YihY/BrkB family envelope integrity protein n=1 Tax=Raineyella sp. TaxID=1911550 RepID=UPI002B1FAC31|nr:YhjD/YihY/BrkB family envelope integrity protein [Raineyella sp.]MEA5155759.1 YhjD/YihY/BrkB family envelope integrity protein [Raineyella sp.]
MSKLQEYVARAKTVPWIAHVLRMQDRFGTRLGAQFAGAITYFSVLALVPLLMVTFATVGFILTVARPDLLVLVEAAITEQLSGLGQDLQAMISGIIRSFLINWGAIGIVGLLSGIYSASGWAGNLKSAIRAQTRAQFDLAETNRNVVVETLVNVALMLGLLVLIPTTIALANASTTLTDALLVLIGAEDVPGVGAALRLVGILAATAAGWLLFLYVLTVFPEESFAFRVKWRAALIGSIGLGLLEYLTSFLVASFTSNPAAALFGPVIVLMLFLNLFARLILYVAAWMATAVQRANPLRLQDIDAPLAALPGTGVTTAQVAALQAGSQPTSPGTVTSPAAPGAATAPGLTADAVGSTATAAGATLTGSAAGATITGEREARAAAAMAPPPGTVQVTRPMAVRNARMAMRTGWITGTLTGVGLGTLLAALGRALTRRR